MLLVRVRRAADFASSTELGCHCYALREADSDRSGAGLFACAKRRQLGVRGDQVCDPRGARGRCRGLGLSRPRAGHHGWRPSPDSSADPGLVLARERGTEPVLEPRTRERGSISSISENSFLPCASISSMLSALILARTIITGIGQPPSSRFAGGRSARSIRTRALSL